MSAPSQYRMKLRLLGYMPGRKERYLLRVVIETAEVFAALPYKLLVEHAHHGTVLTFNIRGLAIGNTFPNQPQAASYVNDIVVERDGEVMITISRSNMMQSFSLIFERGSMQISRPPTGKLLDVQVENSTEE